MKLKLDENGNVVVVDGKPVYVHDDGKEIPFDAVATAATISRLNGEAKGHRERAEAAETALKSFEGITDPKAALAAITTVQNLDAKKLVEAGEVDRIRQEAIKATEEKYGPTVTELENLKQAFHNEKIGGSFARSAFVAEKLGIPVDMVQAFFGNNFRLEENQVVAYGQDGNKIFSRSNPGEVAAFDEALEILVDRYPNRDRILKSSGASGSGAQGGTPGAGGNKTVARKDFDGMAPLDQAAFVKGGGKITD